MISIHKLATQANCLTKLSIFDATFTQLFRVASKRKNLRMINAKSDGTVVQVVVQLV